MKEAYRGVAAPEPCNFDTRRTCLFLDVDGTLLEIRSHPREVQVDAALVELLGRLHSHLSGAVALISGRPIEELTRMFAPLEMPMAGIHGFERRSAHGTLHRPTVACSRLDVARETLAPVVRTNPGMMLEDKGSALALHFRGAPHAAKTAGLAMQRCAGELGPGFELLEGSCVIEIKPVGQNKATAIEAFMQEEPFAGQIPVYIGDDRADFDGFGAVRRHRGVDIAVGEPVVARWQLESPSAVRQWLTRFAAQRGRAAA